MLHNWGGNSEVIGVAYLYWDNEYHRWVFNNIAGDCIEGNYDRWRQYPMKIGHISCVSDLRGVNGVVIDEFTKHVLTDKSYEKWDGNWNAFLEAEKKKAEKAFIKKRIKRLKNAIGKKIKDNKEELAELKKRIRGYTMSMKTTTCSICGKERVYGKKKSDMFICNFCVLEEERKDEKYKNFNN